MTSGVALLFAVLAFAGFVYISLDVVALRLGPERLSSSLRRLTVVKAREGAVRVVVEAVVGVALTQGIVVLALARGAEVEPGARVILTAELLAATAWITLLVRSIGRRI